MATGGRGQDRGAAGGAFVLSYQDVARLLASFPLEDIVTDLGAEIESVYRDRQLETIQRNGWPRPPDTLEIMGCQAADLTCMKMISSHPSIANRRLPTVTGTLVCTEVGNDQARLICDTAVLTPLRTAVSTGVVMRRVSPLARSVAIIGAGLEGTSHALVLALMLEHVESIVFMDYDEAQAREAKEQMTVLFGRPDLLPSRHVDVTWVERGNVATAYDCDAIVTATYGAAAVVTRASALRPGTFIAAVGADLSGKRELDHRVYDRARFIADDLEQCLHEGELQHAGPRLRPGLEARSHRGVLLDGRITSVADLLEDASDFMQRSESVMIYDSTGFSGQDLAVARVVLRLLDEHGWAPTEWNPAAAVSLTGLLSGPAPDGSK